MPKNSPEAIAWQVVDLCAGCECCRDLLEDLPCQVFAELFRLSDREKETGEKGTTSELRTLVDLCNLCGLCPCPNVRTDMRKAKDAFIERDGLKATIRVLEDVAGIAKICGAFPRLSNAVMRSSVGSGMVKRIAGIHPDRKLPIFPSQSVRSWVEKRGLNLKREGQGRKVAYFAGCTAQYLFPEVAKATIEVLERNEIEVYFPEQKCCGMPSLLEGDRQFTSELAGLNLETLGDAVDQGYDIVCSCPTCGYMLKNLFSEGAYFSDSYRTALAAAGGDPDKIRWDTCEPKSDSNPRHATPCSEQFKPPLVTKLILSGMLRDEGYFSSFDGRQRIKVASHTYDLGEYLANLRRASKLNVNFGQVEGRMGYYPPCHLKEQNVGQPWSELLTLIPGISLERVGGPSDCCGMAGIMGFKREFHEMSIAMGSRLMEKIRIVNPEKLLSDCLSCRVQFNQMLPYDVLHPVEVLNQSYAAFKN